MRNLKLITNITATLDSSTRAHSFAIDNDTETLYVATSTEFLALQPSTSEVLKKINFTEVSACGDCVTVVNLQYLPEESSLCAALSNGDLLLWNTLTEEIECVGSVDSGTTAMCWSPDMELIILTTGDQTFIMMTREFDPISESPLHPEKFGEAEFVQVGWGKKETQFHGSAGKAAAKQSQETVNPAQSWDDRKPRITWRGDGQYFAISTVHPQTGARKMCVWTREGGHHSTSENVDGIEQALSWKPSGSLIATSQRRPNKHDIAFFELNGLRHGEFTLPFSQNQVKVNEVLWNIDSTVLLVWCEDLQDSPNKKSYVQLWTCGNYHWYLKQTLQFDINNQTVAMVMWDPEQTYRLHILCREGQYYRYTWGWNTTCSNYQHGQSIVAVIDGAKVLMTPMRHMIVPPPMCAYQLELPAPVNHVVFSPVCDDVAVTLTDNRIALYTFTDSEKSREGVKVEAAGGTGFVQKCHLPTLKEVYRINGLADTINETLYLSHFVWITEDMLMFASVTMTPRPHSVLHKAMIDNKGVTIINSQTVESCVYGIACDPGSGSLAVQLTDGAVLKYTLDDDLLLPWTNGMGDELKFPVPCIQMAVCEIGGEVAVLGLTDRYRFYVNEVEVASNCTSFSVHDEYLLLTTLTHTCRCICRKTKIKDLPSLSDGKAHPFDESIRRVERGSRIVLSVPDDTKLVLQMPRGNLETIHPRALVLSLVRKYLTNLNFGEAFMMMKKHRINMNLIYDHNPSVFLQNVKLFIEQVKIVNHINLFLTDLIEEDVTVTMYTAAYDRNKDSNIIANSTRRTDKTKVDIVCDAVRQALLDIDENRYLLSILTSYVRKTSSELEQALQLVKKLRDCENEMPHISAEEALKYLLFLVDVNELFDIALGTYDFDLVMMVAEKSQKDPKEYIPFLNGLRKLEKNYQQYTIDKHLKQYDRALQHICKCGSEYFSECMSLISEHKLHKKALQIFPNSSEEYKAVASSYGEVLSGKRRHEEAAIMYTKAESWDMALDSYLSGGEWQMALCMAARLKYTPEQMSSLATKLSDDLKSRHKYWDASVVLEQYGQDIEEAIVTLVEGNLWDESLRMMYKYNRPDFIETDLKPHLIDTYNNHLANLEEMEEKFNKHKTRLHVVRQEKEKARLAFMESGGGNQDSDLFSDTSSATDDSIQSSEFSTSSSMYSKESGGGNQDSDLFSDTSSATGDSIQSSEFSTSSSMYSKMSGRSQKNRRKAEHKKWKLKEGSEFEDFALIAAMAKTITYVDGLREEIKAILKTLVRFNYDKEAETLQRSYDSMLSLLDKSIPEIWVDEPDHNQGVTPVLGPEMTANSIALAMQKGTILKTGGDTEEPLDPVIRIPLTLQKDLKWKFYAFET